MKNRKNKIFLLCFFATCVNVLAGCQHLEGLYSNLPSDYTSNVDSTAPVTILSTYKVEKIAFINNYFKLDTTSADYLATSLDMLETLRSDAALAINEATGITTIDKIVGEFIIDASKINTYEESLAIAYNFKKDFSTILSQNFSRVNIQEEAILELAETAYAELTDDVKELLKSEIEVLESLRLKIENLKSSIYVVEFDSNGGTAILNQEVQYGNKLLAVISPIKEGYSFEGWYTDTDFTTRFNFEELISTDLTLHAKWNISKSLLTLLDSDGSKLSSKSYDYNSQVTIEAPVKSGKTFIGWYSSPAFDVEVTSINMPLNGTVLYARWIDGSATIVENNQSIQNAINESNEDAIIFVKPGFYSEALTIDKSMTLLGNNFNNNVNETRLPETIITPVSAEGFNYYFENISLEISANNVTVNGITFNGDNSEVSNIWKTENQDQLNSVRSTSDSANASAAYLNTMINQDLHIDSGIAIYASTGELKKVSNLNVSNNIIKNYSQYGVMVYGGLSSKGGEFSNNVLVKNNHFENIIGLPLLKNSNGVISFAGHYGRAIEFSSGVEGEITKNNIVDSTMGISVYYNYSTDHKILISENSIVDTAAGIWVNTTKVGEETIISKNTILLTEDYVKPMYVDDKNFLRAITISSVEGSGRMLINENTISNYRIGINVSGNQAGVSIDIQKNNFNKIEEYAIAVSNYIFGYSFLGQRAYLNIHSDNIYNNSEKLHVDEFNAGAIQTINLVSQDSTITNIYGTLATPKLTLKSTRTEVSWAAIASASGYQVYINGEEVATLESTTLSYVLPLNYDEKITVQVRALAGEASGYLTNSGLSAELQLVKYTKVETIYTTSSNITTTSTSLFAIPGTKLSTLLGQTKSGYTFTGWYNDDAIINLDLEINSNITFSTQWLKNYTVKCYDTNKTLISTETVAAGQLPNLPLENVKWYTHATQRTATYLYTTGTAVEGNLNLYAVAI